MLKVMKEKWDKNQNALKERIGELTKKKFNEFDYIDIVKMTFENIFNKDEEEMLDIKNITEIDNGDYQGTLLYLIPFDTYQPSEYEYLMTHVSYGSCSGCDTLQSLQDWSDNDELLTIETQSDLLGLCRDLIVNTIKPYNGGWRNDNNFETIEE